MNNDDFTKPTTKGASAKPGPQSSPAPETDDTRDGDGLVRLHKLLAHRGIASRRKCEQLIASGLVSVNGTVVTEPGSRVNPDTDRILVEGKSLPRETESFLFLFYKPRGVVSTLHDPEGRPTLREFFPAIDPLLHIGRLDFQTEGALLLTNNGDLSQRILHPRYAIPRTYLVKIQGRVSPDHAERISAGGVRLDGRPVTPLEFFLERTTDSNAWYRITLTEGRNREVRRLFEALNYFVLKLVRTAIGPLTLAGLEPGEYRPVSPSEIRSLLAGDRPAHLPKTLDSRHRAAPPTGSGTRREMRPVRKKEYVPASSPDRKGDRGEPREKVRSGERDRPYRSGEGKDRERKNSLPRHTSSRPSRFSRSGRSEQTSAEPPRFRGKERQWGSPEEGRKGKSSNPTSAPRSEERAPMPRRSGNARSKSTFQAPPRPRKMKGETDRSSPPGPKAPRSGHRKPGSSRKPPR